MNEQESLLEFPCRFPIKVMGRNLDEFKTVVTDIIVRHASLVAETPVETRASGEGNFVSVTVTIEAQSRPQLDAIYRDLADCEQVLMAL